MSQAAYVDSAPTARRNRIAFFTDYVLFGLALTVVNPNTTLPAFAARLTDSKVLIGLVNAVWFGGWLLPQLFAANMMSTRRNKLPILKRASWIGRPFFWLYAIFLLLGGAAQPKLALVVFLAGFLVFVVTDAVAALAYFDLFGKAMGAKQRGRVVGYGQAVHGLIAIGAGWLVQRLLSDAGPAFPLNYAAVFGLAGVFVIGALTANYFIVELPGEVKETRARWRDYLPQLGAILRHDRAYGRVTAIRLLAGVHMLAAPFYVIYATQVAGLPEASVGLFVTAQTIGGAVAGLVLGWVATRFGTRRVVQASVALDVLAVTLALTLAVSGVPGQLAWVFPLIFALLGMVEASFVLGYFNYVLDIAPETERPVYMGLTNTLAGGLVVMPLLGGWLLEHTSYTTLFAVTLFGVAPAALLALTLPQPAQSAEPDLHPVAHDLQGPG